MNRLFRTTEGPGRGAQPARRWIDLRQLRRRKFCFAVMAYAVGSWTSLQILDGFFQLMGISDWSLKILMLAGALGLPVLLLVGWISTLVQRPGADHVAPAAPARDRRPNHLEPSVAALTLALSLALTILLVVRFLAPGA
jgi:hypothetical protein